MKDTVIHLVEMILGAALLGMALLYLKSQQDTLNNMVDAATDIKLEQDNLYQQYDNSNSIVLSDEEICSQIMGYREYPIIIDGREIAVNEYYYDTYFSYLRDGYYIKSYDYNTNHKIQKIIFTYSGI